MGLLALAMAAPAATAAENDDDYKAEAAIRACASVLSQGYAWFRADYDRGKKSIQTNVQPGEQEKAVSAFERCLISQGVYIHLPH